MRMMKRGERFFAQPGVGFQTGGDDDSEWQKVVFAECAEQVF